MSSKEESFWTKLVLFLVGCAVTPIGLLFIIPTIAWWAFWGAKISLALTVAFGWPLLSFTKAACVLLVARFIGAKYEQKSDDDTSRVWAFMIVSPVIFWLSVVTFIWLGS